MSFNKDMNQKETLKTLTKCDKCLHGYFLEKKHKCLPKIAPVQKKDRAKDLIFISSRNGDVWRSYKRKKMLIRCRQFKKCGNIVERYNIPLGKKSVLCFGCREEHDRKRNRKKYLTTGQALNYRPLQKPTKDLSSQ